jgi:hypothetical protein
MKYGYKILNVDNDLPSLGVILFLYKKYPYMNSQIIQRLDKKYDINHRQILIDKGLLTEKLNSKPGRFGNPARLFYLTDLVFTLQEEITYDESLCNTIDSLLHLINGMSFNHWKYNYQNITVNIPDMKLMDFCERDRKNYNHIKTILNIWGNPDWRPIDYNIRHICMDDKFSERTYNFFTNSDKSFRKYIFNDPIEIDVHTVQPLLLANKLIKNFWSCDYTKKFETSHYDIYMELGQGERGKGRDIFNNAVFGYIQSQDFINFFEEANELIFKIKNGTYFKKFSETPMNDKSIFLEDKSKAVKHNALYYKILSKELQMEEVRIMRKVWTELKKRKILFVPIHDSIILDSENEEIGLEIMERIWRQEIDKRLNIYIKKK